MLVDLIRPPNPTSIDDLLDEPLGLLYLAASLRDAKIDVRVTDLAGETDWDIKKADIYGIQLFTPTAHIGSRIAKHIKAKYPEAVTVAGGPHVSACKVSGFDTCICGEGDYAFPGFVMSFQRGHKCFPRYESMPIDELDFLPFPARDLVDMMSYHRKVDGHRCFGIIGSRGCHHKCTFCDRSLFGNVVRYRSIKNIVAELKQVIDTYGVRHFEFFDDMFPGSKARAQEFYSETKGMGLSFRCNARADSSDIEYYSLLKASGCSMIYFGIESGVQEMLNLMKKGTTVGKNLLAIKAAQDAGLKVGGYFILGFPGETRQTIEKTMEFIEKSGIDQAQFYMFIPLPGSEVYKNLDKYGAKLLTTDYSEYYHVAGEDGHGGRVIETPWLSADDMQEEMQRVRKFLRERGSKGGMQDYYKGKLKYKEVEK